MALPLPSSLSPSKVSSFKDCALAFRFSAIDKLPETPGVAAVKGTLVHKVLERLFWEHEGTARTIEVALANLAEERQNLSDDEEWQALALPEEEHDAFFADAEKLVHNYFKLEDPTKVNATGTELMLEAEMGSMKLRGIIDRLEQNENGDLVVVDYKTGRAPSEMSEQTRMGGVHFYAFLCERVLGKRPVEVKLLHLREPVSISVTPSEQTIRALQTRTSAIWKAVERACEQEDFRPKPGRLCNWCSFHDYCPAQGGTLPAFEARDAQPVQLLPTASS